MIARVYDYNRIDTFPDLGAPSFANQTFLVYALHGVRIFR